MIGERLILVLCAVIVGTDNNGTENDGADMAVIEIGDDNEENEARLREWLEPMVENNREIVTAIAHRVAMRSVTNLVGVPKEYPNEKWAEPLTLHSMRALLLSSLAGIWPSDDRIISADFAARSAATSALSALSADFAAISARSTDFAALSARSAALSARSAASSASSALSARSAASSALSASSAALSALSASSADFAAIWESVRRDIAFIDNGGRAKALLAQPVWITGGYEGAPDHYGWSQRDLNAIKAFGKTNGQANEWDFWGRWLLENHRGGMRSDRRWEMLRKIGLIDKTIWDDGEEVDGVVLRPAQAIAMRIGLIEGEYLEKTESTKRARVQEQVTAQLRVASLSIESAEGLKKLLDQIVREAMVGTNDKPDSLMILESISHILGGLSSAASDENSSDYKDRILELEAKVLELTSKLEQLTKERDEAKDDARPQEWKIFNEELAKGTAVTINWSVRIGVGYFLYQINPELINALGKIMPSIK